VPGLTREYRRIARLLNWQEFRQADPAAQLAQQKVCVRSILNEVEASGLPIKTATLRQFDHNPRDDLQGFAQTLAYIL
jgi:hypothetical protein